MPETDPLDALRGDLDYERLIAGASPALRQYIQALEQENAHLRQQLLSLRAGRERRPRATTGAQGSAAAAVATVQHAQDVMVITITGEGLCKRTPLNDYGTQRRGGVGVFDIQAARGDLVAHLLVARASAALLLLTDRGRAFRLPVETLTETEVRARGSSLPERLQFSAGEQVAAVINLDEDDPRSTVLLATTGGWVRAIHRNYVGPRLQPGTLLVDTGRGGAPAAMALSDGNGDVLVGLRGGTGIRFSERMIRRDGVRGIQVRPDDRVVGVASIHEEGSALLVTADGKGTVREMSGFAANKSPGAQGKVLMKTEALAGLAAVGPGDDVLCISAFAKIIRFAAAEIPPKTGVVQGVAVLDCRGDRLAALAVVPPPAGREA